jgi:hypothetical protein
MSFEGESEFIASTTITILEIITTTKYYFTIMEEYIIAAANRTSAFRLSLDQFGPSA